jgi:hypothetical protein
MIDIITILTLIINTNPQLIIRWQWRMCIQPINLHRNKNLYIDGRSMRVVERWWKKFWSRGMDRGRWVWISKWRPRERESENILGLFGAHFPGKLARGQGEGVARVRPLSSGEKFMPIHSHATDSTAVAEGDSSARGGVVHGRKQLRGNLSAAVMGLAEMALVLDTARWSSSSSGRISSNM